MATRTTSTKPDKKSPTAKPASGIKRITAPSKTAPVRKAPAPVEAKQEPEPAPKPEPPEVVSLIEPKPPRAVKRKESEAKPQSFLPPISRVVPSASGVQAPPPAPVPPAAPVEVPDAAGGDEQGTEEKIIHIKPPILLKDLAAQMGLKPFKLIGDLMVMNIFPSSADTFTVEADIAAALCSKHGFVFEKEKRDKEKGYHKPEVVVEAPPAPVIEKEEELKFRAPIITFMGHVDHGKTSLMDAIRKTRVAAGEAGGITQHVAAYSVEHKKHKITFIDTPGHAAFTAMRARGANVTDIVVLVVAADDGIMPQTVEAINHAKAAGVSIIVAINKIDLPGANVDRVKTQLQDKGLAPEDWGGQTICCPVSATKGTGIDHLLEMMLLQAEVLELKASPTAPPRCTVIEAQMEAGRGPTATVIVRMGTLKAGDPFICGNYHGKVRSLISDSGKPVKEAGPSTPVNVVGFVGLPNAGDELLVMESERAAKALSEERLNALRSEKLTAPKRATLETLFDNLAEGARKNLQIVLKCNVQGSLEALVASLKEIKSTKIDLEIIHAAVGPITENDVNLASAPDRLIVIIGFNVKVENSASTAAKREGVQIKLYSIIYELIDQVKEAMAGMLEPELREAVIGHAEVLKVFELSKGIVAGCRVTDGRIARTARARVLRKRQPIYDGGIATLRRFQDDVKEVRSGVECGLKLGDFTEYEEGDIIECYTLEKVAQKL